MNKIKIDLNIDVFNDELKEMRQKVYEDEKLLSLLKKFNVSDELIDKNIVKIYSYKLDRDYCASCKGQKNCKKENPLLSSELYFDGKFFETKLIPCKEVLGEMAIANRFIINDMSEANKKATFSKIDKNATSKVLAAKYFTEYFKNGESKWIYLTGSIHTGRSFLASAFVNACAVKGVGDICYIDTPFRFKELYDKSFNDLTSYSALLETIKTAKVLVIDDFGNEVKNDYVRDGILSLILSARSDLKLLTIFTSDYTIDEIETLYATSKAGAIRAKQIKNLLKANSKVFDLGNLKVY